MVERNQYVLDSGMDRLSTKASLPAMLSMIRSSWRGIIWRQIEERRDSVSAHQWYPDVREGLGRCYFFTQSDTQSQSCANIGWSSNKIVLAHQHVVISIVIHNSLHSLKIIVDCRHFRVLTISFPHHPVAKCLGRFFTSIDCIISSVLNNNVSILRCFSLAKGNSVTLWERLLRAISSDRLAALFVLFRPLLIGIIFQQAHTARGGLWAQLIETERYFAIHQSTKKWRRITTPAASSRPLFSPSFRKKCADDRCVADRG